MDGPRHEISETTLGADTFRSRLVIRRASAAEEGKYVCVAKNSIGSGQAVARIHSESGARPSFNSSFRHKLLVVSSAAHSSAAASVYVVGFAFLVGPVLVRLLALHGERGRQRRRRERRQERIRLRGQK